MHMVGWNKTIKPIKIGNLGTRLVRLQNTALLDKID